MRKDEGTQEAIVKSLERMATALEALANPHEKPSKDIQAVVLILTLKKPTQRAISRQLGYKSHRALAKLPLFQQAWRRWEIMKTITAGDGRSVTRDFDSEFDEDGFD